MNPAIEPNMNCKEFVRRGYDYCAEAYSEARQHGSAGGVLAGLLTRLPEVSRILDLGCGPGIPITSALAERHHVVGVDISPKMVELAKRNVPNGTFVCGDIMAADLVPMSFDAVVALYVIFHLPREEHESLFRHIYAWLRPGGYLLVTVSLSNEAPYIEEDFFGTQMYWSNFSESEYQALLTQIGFNLLEIKSVGHGYGPVQEREESHPLILAQRPIVQ
jgi:SAM-dependent methyltransferase